MMSLLRRISLLSLALAMLVTGGTGAQAPLPPELAPTFFPANNGWRVGPYQGTKLDLGAAIVDGRPVYQVGPTGLVLISKEKLTSDCEIRLRFRITSPEDKGSWLSVTPGMAKDTDSPVTPLRVHFQVYAGQEPEGMLWQMPPLPDTKNGAAGWYTVPNLPKGRLTWPDLVRRRAEAEFAGQPRLTQRWMTLRVQLRKNDARVFLDDRVLRAAHHPKLETGGFVRCDFQRGVEIASLSVVHIGPNDSRFENVPLEGYVNAEKFRGQDVAFDASAGKSIQVGGVPFVLAQPDEKKRDHVDLKPSWLSCGVLDGDFSGAGGEMSRWRGAMVREPGRIQFRVPQGSYSKLHLLAAFSGEPDTTPVVGVQFYRAGAGHPVNFAGSVPLFSAASPNVVAVGLGASKANLHLVTIPLDPNGAVAFSDQDHLEFELTKLVRTYRSFPDPIEYSHHGAGLPSGVHVYGITLEKPHVEVDFQPDAFAHIWTAPARPSYTVKLKNTSAAEQTVNLELATASYDGKESTVVKGTAKVAPGAEQAVPLALELKKYGHHDVELKIHANGETRTQKRSLAHLHADTRERGNWEEGKGPIFGLWDWNGGHGTPGGLPRLQVSAAAGMESAMNSYTQLPKEEQQYLESIGAQSFFLAYQLAMNKTTLNKETEWDPKKPAEMQAALLRWLKSRPMAVPSKINRPELAVFFAEPIIGPISYMAQPEHFGEPPHEMTAEEKANYQKFLDQFVIAGQAIKKEWPQAKLLMPWGIPSFPIPFLRHSKEARDLMDGPALDVVLFERLPEMQIHQVTLSSVMWQLKQEWLKHGKAWPKFSTIEGPCISPAHPSALTPQEESDNNLRTYLIMAGYGTTRTLGWPVAFHCAGYWGETHYGTGLCERQPLHNPRPVYSSYAAYTRQVNRMNFEKSIPTGSNTVFCYQFKHYKTGELLHVLWTLKGKRPIALAANAGAKATVFDDMDNATAVQEEGGKINVIASSAPIYVRGLTADAKITLGTPDHSDALVPPPSTAVAVPGAKATTDKVALGQLGDGTWKLTSEPDPIYEDTHAEFIRRFPGKFSVKTEPGDKEFGKALAVHLEKQDKERKTMPFYSALVPAKPIVIPGKASHIGLWVKAASDWGRVVYCLKDAKGERWVSVGQKGEWNVDDTRCWSQFCFDGSRYLRFEMPANAPYDAYREMGTSYWGHYGAGDGIVDYPLSVEKIIVERRTHVIAGVDQQPASPDDVLLGGLYAEYESSADKTPEAVRQAKLRMPLPIGLPALGNPLKKLTEASNVDGPKVSKVNPPEREYDGKRCHVHFTPLADAAKYDVWVSPYADGRGAIRLAKSWTKSGELLTGLSPNIDLYLFVVAEDANGKSTKPGPAFKINLKDMFPMR